MEGGELTQELTSWIPATQELPVPPHQSQGIVSKSVSQKCDYTFFGHTSISLVAPFYTSCSSRNLIVSYLASTGSCLFLARTMLDFISSYFPPSSPLTTAPHCHPMHLQQKCKLQKLFVFHGHSHIMPKRWPKSLAGNLNPRIRELMMNGCEAFVIAQAPLWLEQWRRTQVWLRRATDKTVGENGGLLPT